MPISAFAHALRAFQIGDLTQDELTWEIDRQLAIEKASPMALMEVLKFQQVAQPLPGHAHDAILHHLEEWPRDPTVVTGLNRRHPAAQPPSAGVGDILQGRFSLVALIGEGGMSRVFKAIDLRRVEAGAADPYVAVKVLTEPLSEYFGSIVALQRETHKLESLSHPNIVRVIDCDRDGQTVFMTMEYLSGQSLQKRLRIPGSSDADRAAALSIIAAVGSALEYAHGNHIVHGDLKPGNILITDKGVIKVIDFGMARFIARPDEGLPAEPAAQSTPKAVTLRYASPEMVAGRDPEPADDVYALACIAYEALSGRHPFGRQSDPRGRDPHARPPRPPGMRRHQYAALVGALVFDRTKRTPTIRRFLDQLLQDPAVRLAKRWGWAIIVGVIGVVLLISGLHSRPSIMAGARESSQSAPDAMIHDCPSCPAMVVVPAGRFEQGEAGAGDAAAGDVASAFAMPRHRVVIAHAFAMSANDVTVGEYREFVAATHREMSGCNVYDGHWQYQKSASWQAPGFAQNVTHPVTCVSWDDAAAYAGWLSEKARHVYRLPSSSEWEYAARAGADVAQPWGADAASACVHADVADETAGRRYPGWTVFPCSDGYVNTAPVGTFKSNAFGLNDLLGNVFTWVQDCWYDDYVGAPTDGAARGGACAEHELRGGSWFTSPQYVNSTYRNRFESGYRSSTVGFRLVREMGQ